METRNPVLKSRTFSGYARPMELGESMTIQGTVNKTGILLLLAFASAAWVWQIFYTSGNPSSVDTNKAIGKELGISPRTVSTHLSNIFQKLELGSRAELGDKIRDEGLLES